MLQDDSNTLTRVQNLHRITAKASIQTISLHSVAEKFCAHAEAIHNVYVRNFDRDPWHRLDDEPKIFSVKPLFPPHVLYSHMYPSDALRHHNNPKYRMFK